MINKNTLQFLKDLKLNNAKDWLNDNKSAYDHAKSDILTLASELIKAISAFDLTISGANLEPKKCITRLNRDLRFAKDKTPYKTDYYIVLNHSGKNSPSAFYYLHIEPNNCFVGGGVYNPEPEQLRKIRQEIDYAFDEWNVIINNQTFKQTFPSGINNSGILTRIPKEFDESSEASKYLKMKGYFTKENLSDNEMLTNETFTKIISCFKNTKPLVDFLNRAISSE